MSALINDKWCASKVEWLFLLSGLFRVKRLGYFDHTQRQLGERALYVFPAKGDATRITCEGPEGAPVLPEDPVIRKVRGIHTLTSYKLSYSFIETEKAAQQQSV